MHDDELDALRQAVETTLLHESLRMGIGEATAAVDDLVRRVEQRLHPPSTPTTSDLQEYTNPFTALGSLLKTLARWISGASSTVAHPGAPNLHPDNPFDAIARSFAIMTATNAWTHVHHSLNPNV